LLKVRSIAEKLIASTAGPIYYLFNQAFWVLRFQMYCSIYQKSYDLPSSSPSSLNIVIQNVMCWEQKMQWHSGDCKYSWRHGFLKDRWTRHKMDDRIALCSMCSSNQYNKTLQNTTVGKRSGFVHKQYPGNFASFTASTVEFFEADDEKTTF